MTVLDIKLEALVTVLKMESIVFLVLTNWMDWRALVYVYCWKNKICIFYIDLSRFNQINVIRDKTPVSLQLLC